MQRNQPECCKSVFLVKYGASSVFKRHTCIWAYLTSIDSFISVDKVLFQPKVHVLIFLYDIQKKKKSLNIYIFILAVLLCVCCLSVWPNAIQ